MAGFIPGSSGLLRSVYPLFPWLGVTTAGIALGKIMVSDSKRSFTLVLKTGIGLLIFFFALRTFFVLPNFEKPVDGTFLTYFTLIKYPPSIYFLSFTIGINLLLLYLFHQLENRKWLAPLKLFGQTALFFYLAHLYLYMIVGLFFRSGTTIGMLYLIWPLVLIPLYFICKRYLKFKRGKPLDSIWRFF